MKDQIIAKIYAKSLIELGESAKIDVVDELTRLNVVINENGKLETLLFLDTFTTEEKAGVLEDVTKRLGLSKLSVSFLSFLLLEKRMGIFPLIFKETIVIDDHRKGFMRGTIEGHEDVVDQKTKDLIAEHLKKKLEKNIDLKYVQNKEITAGYRVTVEDLQIDASLERQLAKFKDQVLSSDKLYEK
jgi:F-type H+-transporting ATPase subunit delta